MEPGKQRPIQSMEEARDWERRFIGEIKAGRDPRRPPNRAMKAQHANSGRLGVSRCLLGALREAGRASKRRRGAQPDRRAEGTSRATAAVGARRTGRDQPVQDRLGVRRGRGDRVDAPRARNAAGGDELGHGADAAAVHQVAVSPLRRSLEQESRRRRAIAGSHATRRSGCSTRRCRR